MKIKISRSCRDDRHRACLDRRCGCDCGHPWYAAFTPSIGIPAGSDGRMLALIPSTREDV